MSNGEKLKEKKCDECFQRKPDVKMRGYEDAEVPLCDECFYQNQAGAQVEAVRGCDKDLKLKINYDKKLYAEDDVEGFLDDILDEI